MREDGRHNERHGGKRGRQGFAESKYLTVSWGLPGEEGSKLREQRARPAAPSGVAHTTVQGIRGQRMWLGQRRQRKDAGDGLTEAGM